MERCYNCGLPGHLTQYCPSYGPRFPAPGKSSQDYGDETQRISNLIAGDIVQQHEERHQDDEQPGPGWGSKSRASEKEMDRRSHRCPTCGASVGERCISKVGKPINNVHVARSRLVEDPSDQLQGI